MSHKKCGPDRFSRFDVYWIQTNKQTPKQTPKPTLYIDRDLGIPIEKLSRRHFINTFDVLEVL